MLLAFSPFRESYLVFKVKLCLKLAFSFGCVAANLSHGGFSLHLVVNGFNLVYRVQFDFRTLYEFSLNEHLVFSFFDSCILVF